MSKKILVTGGAGFIGSYLVDALVEKGHDVVILDLLEPQVHGERQKTPEYLNTKADFKKGDVRLKENLKDVIENADVIFHEAAQVGVGQSMYEITKYVDHNSLGTATLLEILVDEEHDVKKLVVASSMSIYGEGAYRCEGCEEVYPKLRPSKQLQKRDWEMHCPICENPVSPAPTNEDKPLYPTSIYAVTKRDQEEMCLSVGFAYGIPTVALRYFNVYGPRQSLSNPYTGVAAIFSSRIKNDHDLVVYEDGDQSRDFINIKDIVTSNLLVMESSKADYESFNVGTGRPTTINELGETLIRLYNKPNLKIGYENKFRSGDIRHCVADISKIKSIGFKPSVSVEQGLSELVSWGEQVESVDKVENAAQELREKGLVK
ncbi:MAG: SDR family NAD(P)-dependent oxidoreductase [Candidatus Altiarchaeota archaeon]